jgi:hypothetical protein
LYLFVVILLFRRFLAASSFFAEEEADAVVVVFVVVLATGMHARSRSSDSFSSCDGEASPRSGTAALPPPRALKAAEEEGEEGEATNASNIIAGDESVGVE